MNRHGTLICGIAIILGTAAALFGEDRPRLGHPTAQYTRVGEILIIGNTLTRDSVIRGRVTFCPGDWIHGGDLEIARDRIHRLNRFRCVTVEVLNGESTSGPRDILIAVEQRRKPSESSGVWCIQTGIEDLMDVVFGEEVGGFLLTLFSEVLEPCTVAAGSAWRSLVR
jgi:hypothetical protein